MTGGNRRPPLGDFFADCLLVVLLFLVIDSHDELRGRIEGINPELDLEDPNNPQLRLGESTHILPALPLENTDEEEKN